MSVSDHQWVKKIQSLALQAQDLPMWGNFPSFPWEELSKHLKTALSLEDLQISPGTADWKSADQLILGLGERPFSMGVTLTPLEGNACLLFSREDFSKLASWMIGPETSDSSLTDLALQEGFFHYLSLEGARALDRLGLFKDLSPTLAAAPALEEASYCIDFALHHSEAVAWGRIVCLPDFHRNFKAHFSQKYLLSTPRPLYRDVTVDLSLYAGSTKLKQTSWATLNPGDLILLNHCSYFPQTKKGTFQLILNETPLFQVKVKEEHMKILDYALYYEDTHMDNTPDDDDFDATSFGELSDEDLSDTDKTSFEETIDEDLPDTDETSFEETIDEDLSDPEDTNEIDSALEDQDASLDEAADEDLNEDPAVDVLPKEALVSPDKVPLVISVEVAKMKMTLDQLLTLKPGSVLSLSVHPDQDVHLVTSGKRIARGQMVQIGEVIGVKVTEVGNQEST